MNTYKTLTACCLLLSLSLTVGCSSTASGQADAPSKVANDAGGAKQLVLDLGKEQTMKLMLIPAGTFMMGNHITPKETGELYGGKNKERFIACEYPQHEVTISKPFYMGIYEVSQAQWKAVMGTEPWQEKTQTKIGDEYPAAWMTSHQASEYCQTLSKKTGRKISLPTEAQWEYACRAGSTKSYCYGSDDQATLTEYAWIWDNTRAGKPPEPYAHPVGLKKPNAWGLYDMHGNLWEFCSDWFDKDFYARSPKVDPENTTETTLRGVRGGSWHNNSRLARATSRSMWTGANYVHYNYGFRVVVAASSD
jgi:formylglycine-generating enzyme required for sulfatase activity